MNNVPTKTGLYWAKWRDTAPEEPYTMIIKVIGEAPFLRAHAWYLRFNDTGFIPDDKIREIVWGPEIIIPKAS